MKFRVLIAVAVLALIGGLAVRSTNARHANQLATAVIVADGSGNPTAAPLANLKAYIKGHQGAHASFTLTKAYNDAVTAAKSAAQIQASNSQIYAAAQAACSGKTDSITQAKCNQAYLQAHLIAEPANAPVTAPALGDYQYHMSAPFWTADLAGWLELVAIIAGAIGIIGILRRRS